MLAADVASLPRHLFIPLRFHKLLTMLGYSVWMETKAIVLWMLYVCSRAGNVTQLVQCLVSMQDGLGSASSIAYTGQSGTCLQLQHSGNGGRKIRHSRPSLGLL